VQTQERKAKALRLASAITEMLALAPQAGGRQPGFALARNIVAHSLDYDAGVLPCSNLLPHASAIDDAVLNIVAVTVDMLPDQFTEEQRLQIQLPTRCAGMQVDLPTRLIPLARTARIVEAGPALREAVASWAPEVNPLQYDGVDQAVNEGILRLTAERGLEVIGGSGRPVAAGQPAAADPLRPAVPEKHLLSSYLRHCADAQYTSMLARADERSRTRLISAGGPTAGTSFVAQLGTAGVSYTDRQWAAAVQWRLGITVPGPQTTCVNENYADECCGQPLDAAGDHAVDCPTGPLRNRRHDDLADIYADILEEVGAVARREVFVPELSTNAEAWLDTWGYGIQELPDVLLDITVRHPYATRYQPGASNHCGHAAIHSEREKERKYPPARGRSIWAVVHETWGRLGDKAELLLDTCAGVAARRAYRRSRMPGNCLRKWRAQLDASLHRSIAAQISAARHGLPGRKRRRVAPADRAVLEGRCPL
jgi:hypothetical protein